MRVVVFARCCALVGFVGSLVLFCGGVMAVERSHPAQQLVEKALSREIKGLGSERDKLLRQALQVSPTYAPAKWHQGMVQVKGRWMKAEAVPGQLGGSRWLAAYQNARKEAPNTAAGQLALANWCRDHKLPDQERAHLTQILEHDPDNTTALARLGFRQIDGRWVALRELRQTKQQQQQSRQALLQWQPAVRKIVTGLNHRKQRQQQIALRQLRKIDDPAAIPALEQAIADSDPLVSILLVGVLDKFRENEAAQALARQSIFSADAEVRAAAAKLLRSRDRDAYVPLMLAAMQTPITTRTLSYQKAGFTVFLHSMTHEDQTERKEVVLQSLRADSRKTEDVQQQNGKTQAINERVTQALNIATEQALPAEPKKWWSWWNDENEIFVEGEKPLYAIGNTEQLARVDRARELEEAARRSEQQRQANLQRALQRPGSSSSSSQRRRDCLAAGTPVWTLAGPIAVEKIQPGDMVLSQDVETGELAYKPVLQTTIRPTSKLIHIEADNDTIQASGGHPFWISGKGWIKARDLKPGMELHCVNGTVRIGDVGDGRQEQTYNLIVADFGTYFIGESKILNHDNTIRQATNAIVPGLIEY